MIPGLLAAAALAQQAEVRFGVFVGDNDGQTGDQQLVFAASDAKKMRDLFVEYGGIAPTDALLLQNVPRRQVEDALAMLRRRIAAAEAGGQHTTLVFYYSGHGDGESLHLGTTDVTHAELRAWLDTSGADVRLGLLDACQSGSAIRSKGGTRGPAYATDLGVASARGTAILTSSSASETSQESAEVGGGFFTHYLHSGLRGAADVDRDGEVSLGEAYAYVHGETVAGTRDAPGAQTPGYDFDIDGYGDVTITTLERATSHIAFLGDLEGVYAVWDEARKRYVAEVDGAHDTTIAVRPGTYYVHHRMPGFLEEASYLVRREETRSVYAEDFVRVSYADSAARGDLDKQVRRANLPDLSLRLVFSARAFSEEIATAYLPRHPLVGVEARLLRPTGSVFYSFDVLSGKGPGVLQIAGLGDVPVTVSSISAGATAGYATRPRLIRAGLGGRVEVVGFQRTFPESEEAEQAGFSFAPGVNAWVGLHTGRFQLDLQWNAMWYAGAFDEHTAPSWAEPTLSIGYRF